MPPFLTALYPQVLIMRPAGQAGISCLCHTAPWRIFLNGLAQVHRLEATTGQAKAGAARLRTAAALPASQQFRGLHSSRSLSKEETPGVATVSESSTPAKPKKQRWRNMTSEELEDFKQRPRGTPVDRSSAKDGTALTKRFATEKPKRSGARRSGTSVDLPGATQRSRSPQQFRGSRARPPTDDAEGIILESRPQRLKFRPGFNKRASYPRRNLGRPLRIKNPPDPGPKLGKHARKKRARALLAQIESGQIANMVPLHETHALAKVMGLGWQPDSSTVCDVVFPRLEQEAEAPYQMLKMPLRVLDGETNDGSKSEALEPPMATVDASVEALVLNDVVQDSPVHVVAPQTAGLPSINDQTTPEKSKNRENSEKPEKPHNKKRNKKNLPQLANEDNPSTSEIVQQIGGPRKVKTPCPKPVPDVQQLDVEASASAEPVHGDTQPQKKLPDWRVQKDALKAKFPDGWKPRKKLSPDALVGIRALNAQYPDVFTTKALSEKFEVDPEAIRRILRSKWQPTAEEEESRELRWHKRGQQVWERKAAVGVKPPKKWRREGIARDPVWHERRRKNVQREQAWEEKEKEQYRLQRQQQSRKISGKFI